IVGQYDLFTGPLVSTLIAHPESLPSVHLIAAAVTLRWFIVMMIYGTIIPNTWRRCAARIAVTLLAPIAITVAAGWVGGTLEFLLRTIIPDMAVFLCMGAAIAVFGSYHTETLQHEAREAKQVGQY